MLDAGMTPYSVMVEQSSSYSSGIELMRQARANIRSSTAFSAPTMTSRSARR